MDNFAESIINIHGEKGREWLEKLPSIIDLCKEKWNLISVIPYKLSYNFVCKVTNQNNENFVLKTGINIKEINTEISILRQSNGYGYVKLIDYDTDFGIMLLEYLSPGQTLAETGHDEAVLIAADIMQKLWMPVPEAHNFPLVSDWYNSFIQNYQNYKLYNSFPVQTIEKTVHLFDELNNSLEKTFILHGDFHHDNILSNGNSWVAIDPKGVIGEPSFELSAFLIKYLMKYPEPKKILERRIDLFVDKLALSKIRICNWGYIQTVAFAWWSYENNFSEWQETLECSEMFLDL